MQHYYINGGISYLENVAFFALDNASAQTASVLQTTVFECGIQQIDHPPYSSDMAPATTICLDC